MIFEQLVVILFKIVEHVKHVNELIRSKEFNNSVDKEKEDFGYWSWI